MTPATRVASTSAVVALVLATLWLFWPVPLGGGTTYVSTYGDSMEPGFSTGDLAVLATADSYSVGDVVAYRSETLDTIVMHRIVAEDSGRFVTQGDNNDWLDEDRPAQDEILGRLFLTIPQGGAALDAVRSPAVLLPLGAVVAAVLGAIRKPPLRRGLQVLRRRARHIAARASTGAVRQAAPGSGTGVGARTASAPTRAMARQIALGAGGTAAVAAVACVGLLVIPSTQSGTTTLQVVQEGRFTYTGAADTGTTYPGGVVATGDTVWNRLVEDLTVAFTTTVTGADPAAVSGVLRLDVVVTAPDGWSSVVASGGTAPLRAGSATASVAVDTGAAAELLDRHYEEIGATGASATLTVTPVSEITGTVQGQTFTAAAPAGLEFTLDELSLRPSSAEQAAYTPSTMTDVPIEEIVAREFPVLGLTVPFPLARTLAGALLLVALGTGCAAAWIARGRGGAADAFVVRHADRVLSVTSFSPGATVIDVSDAESLHRIAERFDTVVLHHAGEDEDVFAVRDVDATYRFVMPGAGERRRGKPPVPAPAAVPAPAPAAVPAPAPAGVPGPATYEPPPLGLWGRVA